MKSSKLASTKPKKDKKIKSKKVDGATRTPRPKEASKAKSLAEEAGARSSLPRDWDKRSSRSRKSSQPTASGDKGSAEGVINVPSSRKSLLRRVLTKEVSSSSINSGESGIVSLEDVYTPSDSAVHVVNPNSTRSTIDIDAYGLPPDELDPLERARRRSSLKVVGAKIGESVGKLFKSRKNQKARNGSIVESIGNRESDASSFTSEFAIHDPPADPEPVATPSKERTRGRSTKRDSLSKPPSASKSPSASSRLRSSLLRRGKSATRSSKSKKGESGSRKSSALRWAAQKKKKRESKSRKKKNEKLHPYPGDVDLRYMAPREKFVPFFGREDTDVDFGDGARLINVKT